MAMISPTLIMAPNKKTGTRVPITYHIKRNKVNQKFPKTLSASAMVRIA